MRMVSATLAGSPRKDEQLPRAFATLHQNYVGGTVYADVMLPSGARSASAVFQAGNTPGAETQRWDAAVCLAEYLDGKDGDPKACLQVVETLLAMGGPGAEPEPEPASDDEADLAEAITDSISPEAAAILATRLQTIIRTDDETINSQCRWFADMLAGLVGGWESAQETAKQYGIE